MLLDLLGEPYELVEVPYGDRNELAALTGGYILVPVLAASDGQVIVESRAICEHLLQGKGGARLVPSPLQGPIWAYADFADGPLEDVMFRIASPALHHAWPTAGERALFAFIKERKFGPGCVEAWLAGRDKLVAQAKRLLAPTLATLAERAFLFGDAPTLADAALYGNCAMLEEGDERLLPLISPELRPYLRRLEAYSKGGATS